MADPNEGIVEQYAQHLLKRAATAVLSWTVMGVILGAFLGGLPRLFRHNLISPSKIYFAILLGAIAGGFLGRSLGEKRALGLRLQAQMALRQLELENRALFGRAPAAPPPAPAPVPVPVAAPPVAAPVAPALVAPPPVAPAPVAPAPVAAPAPIPAAPAVEPLLAPPPVVPEPAPAPAPVAPPAAPPFPVVATPAAPAPPVMPAIRTEATGSVSLPPLTAPPLSG